MIQKSHTVKPTDSQPNSDTRRLKPQYQHKLGMSQIHS